MDFIEKSLKIALEAHAGQKDKAGKAYILHPLRLMARMDSEIEMSVALLHDVIEDSDFTAEDLLNNGIPSNVVNAVQCLTTIQGETYAEFIDRVIKNNLAEQFKPEPSSAVSLKNGKILAIC